MQKEMLNINGNLIGNVEIKIIQGKDGEVKASNFTHFRKKGKEGKGKEEAKKLRKIAKKDRKEMNFKQANSICTPSPKAC